MNENISWGKVAVLVVAIVGVGVLGFVMGRGNDERPESALMPGASIPVRQAEPKTSEKVSELKNNLPISATATYSNDAVGYTFQYPSEWMKFESTAYSSDDIKKVLQVGYGALPDVHVGTLPIDSSLSLAGFDGLKMPSGPEFQLEVFANREKSNTIDSLISAWMPEKERSQVYVKTDMFLGGAPVYEFNCMNHCFVNDPAVVYAQEYRVVPKPGFEYRLLTMVSMNEKDINDAQKKSVLIEKSKQEFRNIIQSFKLK